MLSLKNETLTKCMYNKAKLVQFFDSMYVHSLTTHTQTVMVNFLQPLQSHQH